MLSLMLFCLIVCLLAPLEDLFSQSDAEVKFLTVDTRHHVGLIKLSIRPTYTILGLFQFIVTSPCKKQTINKLIGPKCLGGGGEDFFSTLNSSNYVFM